jgi:hypothetical protein
MRQLATRQRLGSRLGVASFADTSSSNGSRPPGRIDAVLSGRRQITCVFTNHDHQTVAVPRPPRVAAQVTKSGVVNSLEERQIAEGIGMTRQGQVSDRQMINDLVKMKLGFDPGFQGSADGSAGDAVSPDTVDPRARVSEEGAVAVSRSPGDQ